MRKGKRIRIFISLFRSIRNKFADGFKKLEKSVDLTFAGEKEEKILTANRVSGDLKAGENYV